jgi:hypothetical protein
MAATLLCMTQTIATAPQASAQPSLPACAMSITVAAGSVLELHQLALRICGGVLRIEPVDHARRMKVLLCTPAPVLRTLMEAVMRRLPAAEFGRITLMRGA